MLQQREAAHRRRVRWLQRVEHHRVLRGLRAGPHGAEVAGEDSACTKGQQGEEKQQQQAAVTNAAEMESGRVGKVALLLARPERLMLVSSLTTGRRIGWGSASLGDCCSSADARYK